ncbi:MAG: hypothetical protein R6U26_00740 [Candidatus Undinarchaeales archaeon]
MNLTDYSITSNELICTLKGDNDSIETFVDKLESHGIEVKILGFPVWDKN